MAEPFAKPNREQINQALELYGDPFIYYAVNTTIKGLNEYKHPKKYNKFQKDEFYRLCRLIVLNEGVSIAYSILEQSIKDIASDKWKGKDPTKKIFFEINKSFKEYTKAQIKGISIIELAERYGITVKNNKAICPFHSEKEPSLTFYSKTNTFYCFGCNLGGDVIRFYQLIKNIKQA